jgi:predicted dehydrogenase
MAEVLKMAQTNRAPLRPADTLEVLAILAAGVRSAKTGQKVSLADIRGQQ